ncbi:MAG: tetratricopeptide repeat protein, partial [Proteobacteria bacterium]|nr:tetratricopeptide repeat protein [Pseudomonadota bacterium]
MATSSSQNTPLDDALARQNAGDLKGAEAGFKAVLKQDENQPDALILLGMLLQKTGRARAAAPMIERAIGSTRARGSQPDPSWRVALAFARRDTGDFDGALAEIEALLSLSPGHAELLFIKAGLLQRAGRHEDAIVALNALLERDPRSARAWNSLGMS